jgi:hypothetical protein
MFPYNKHLHPRFIAFCIIYGYLTQLVQLLIAAVRIMVEQTQLSDCCTHCNIYSGDKGTVPPPFPVVEFLGRIQGVMKQKVCTYASPTF